MLAKPLTALAAALFLWLAGASVHSAALTEADYKAQKAVISTQYTTENAACKVLSGNARDICIQEAKGHEKISEAQLEADYQPSDKHQFEVRMAKAEAAYAVANEKCDDSAGNIEDVCRKEATSAYVTAKANAKLIEATLNANTEARAKTSEAVKDANTEKRFAAYAVAKEKCEALVGDTKTSCINSAKIEFSQP
jgi:hypothetical protein